MVECIYIGFVLEESDRQLKCLKTCFFGIPNYVNGHDFPWHSSLIFADCISFHSGAHLMPLVSPNTLDVFRRYRMRPVAQNSLIIHNIILLKRLNWEKHAIWKASRVSVENSNRCLLYKSWNHFMETWQLWFKSGYIFETYRTYCQVIDGWCLGFLFKKWRHGWISIRFQDSLFSIPFPFHSFSNTSLDINVCFFSLLTLLFILHNGFLNYKLTHSKYIYQWNDSSLWKHCKAVRSVIIALILY